VSVPAGRPPATAPRGGRLLAGRLAVHQRLQGRAGAVHAALHRADLAADHLGDLLVGQAVHPVEDQHLAVARAQLGERGLEVPQVGVPLLGGRHRGAGPEVVDPDLGRDVAAAPDGVEPVVQDAEQPSLEVGPRREAVPGLERQHDRVLHEVVGRLDVAGGQPPRVAAQVR
jgi:hypothetical protein